MNELRERALATGWRKLVADGITATPVQLRRGDAVKVVDGARTETVPLTDWPARLDRLLADATHVDLLAPDAELHARRTKKGRWLVSRGRPSAAVETAGPTGAVFGHDRPKHHALPDDHPLFGVTKASRDKRRQVQHYVELLRTLPVWSRERIRVVDAGCGKAYMSLALIAYGREVGTHVELIGLDLKEDVVDTVRRVADQLGYDEARFTATAIADFADPGPIDMLVSLHACDTATDDAIAAGVRLEADAIVVAPCCHHELAEQLARRPGKDGLLRHGLLLGRQADLLTDALRAAALEMSGYRVDVIEFVAAEHTAKNVMLRAVRAPSPLRAGRAEEDYVALRDGFGVDPAIGRLLGDRLPVTTAGRPAFSR
jgi:SAM-dependent methyltransferase